jgi:glycosyltransferase involved in cell wall biosynthesis
MDIFGLDATPLPPQPVGAGRYIINLLRALHHLAPPAQLVVIAQRRGRRLIEAAGPLSNIRWVEIPDLSIPLRLLWEQVGLPLLACRLRLDLLHSLHYTRPLWLPCASVVTLHDMTFFLLPELHTRLRRWFFPPMVRYSARAAQALLAVSESTRQDALRLLQIPPARIHTTPLGVDPAYHPGYPLAQRQAVRQKYLLPERFLLYVGTVEPRKNLVGLLQAYARLVSQAGSPPPLVIVGRLGWMVSAVFTEVETLGLKEKVQFTGYVAAEDLPVVFNLAELFVYPSFYEGFGLPPLEGLACGVPVITTAVSSMPEYIGQAGLLVPPGDIPALADAMQRLLADPELRRRLAQAGPPQAAAFTWERTARLTLDVYRQVCDERP